MFKKYLFIVTSLAGLIDAGYLTYEHYSAYIPPCSTNILFADCGKVLNSPYALIFGIPLALIGIFHYSLVILLSILIFQYQNRTAKYLMVLETSAGFLASLYFVFLQLMVIKAICLYCLFSALTSSILFIFTLVFLKKERKRITLGIIHFFYIHVIKPLLKPHW